MPDSLAPPAPPVPPGARPPEVPDPEFWGSPRPTRRERRELTRPRPPGGVFDRATDRLLEWRSDPRAGVAALVVIALVAGLAWYRIGLGSAGGSEGGSAEPAPAAPAATSTTVATGGDLSVHVAGAVVKPGVIELPGGSRVIDAVEAAGGGLPEADLDRMNLAAKLVDGQRVLVQRVGDPAAPAEPPGTGTSEGEGGTSAPTDGPINLNTASQEQLETLPGIGPTLAEAVIAERDRRGGFRSVNELRDVRGIGDKRFADLEGLVTV